MKPPTVTVVMPTYNGEKFLRMAVESVLNQTFTDLELIVIDDASTDSTLDILAEFQDDRIILLRNDRNLGIARATNRALAQARGKYVAPQDQDDISLPRRLAEEVSYLESHPDVALVASAAYLIDSAGSRIGARPGNISDCALRFTFARGGNVITHSSATFRTDAARQLNGYNEDPACSSTVDYELWSRLVFTGKTRILTEALVEYRVHSSATSVIAPRRQELQSESISRAFVGTVLRRELDERWWRAWMRFNWSKVGEAAHFETDEAELLSVITLGLLRRFAHDRNGGCTRPWVWARHALALAIGRRHPISLSTRARFLALAAKITTQKLISH